MKLNLGNLTFDPIWYDFETGERIEGEPDLERPALRIRPRPQRRSKAYWQDGALVISGEEQLETFKYSLVDWRGVTGEDGNPLPCNNAVKEKIFDYAVGGIVPFVMDKVYGFALRKEQEEKNS